MEMTVAIKNMVCQHCVHCVRNVLCELPGVTVKSVWLGGADVDVAGDEQDYLPKIAAALAGEGFELIKTRDAEMVDRVKRVLIEMSRRDDGVRGNLPEMLMEEMRAWSVTYGSLSRLFSSMEGRTIENYFMSLRVERVKEYQGGSRMVRDYQEGSGRAADAVGDSLRYGVFVGGASVAPVQAAYRYDSNGVSQHGCAQAAAGCVISGRNDGKF